MNNTFFEMPILPHQALLARGGRWVSEWSLDLEAYATAQVGRRFKRRMARFEHGTEEYLVSVTDTSAAARRRFSPYAVAPTWVRV